MNKVSYHSKLVGVSFEGRQDVISLMARRKAVDFPVRFRREPENEHDERAVAVDALVTTYNMGTADNTDINEGSEWLPIGYIAKDKNKDLAKILDNGKEASIKISDITGGDDKHYGVNVYIEHESDRKPTRSPNAKLVKDLFGNEIFYDPEAHEYTNAFGEVYLSGSKYAKEEEFDSERWSQEFVNKYGLNPEDKQKILDMWKCNGEASSSFGTSLHAAIELYGTYRHLADIVDIDLKTGFRKKISARVEKNSALSKLPYLQMVVKKFFTPERLAEDAQYEVLVVDHINKRAGRIDRLITLPDGSYQIRDMKTNNKIMKKERDIYTKQLSFYGDIILQNGGKLGDNPIMLHHWIDDEWKDIELPKVNTLR